LRGAGFARHHLGPGELLRGAPAGAAQRRLGIHALPQPREEPHALLRAGGLHDERVPSGDGGLMDVATVIHFYEAALATLDTSE
jgi:hypothetical protein